MSVRRILLVGVLLVPVLLGIGAWLLIFPPLVVQAPYVVNMVPTNGATDILPTSPITITFSTAMDRVSTRNAVSILPEVTNDLVWSDDQTLIVKPSTRFPVSSTVSVNISTEALSQSGRPLQSVVNSQFTTLAHPHVIFSTPAPDAKFIYAPDRVTIVFNRAMEPSLLGDSLVVEPQPQNFSMDMEGDRLTLYGFFKPGLHYVITIPAMVVDAEYGIEMGSDATWSFTATAQYPHFSILNRDRVLQLSANTPLEIPIQYANVSRLDVALYRITREEFDANAAAPFETWYLFQPSTVPLRSFAIETGAKLDLYVESTVATDALEQGSYYLKITTPEGVGDAMLLRVE